RARRALRRGGAERGPRAGARRPAADRLRAAVGRGLLDRRRGAARHLPRRRRRRLRPPQRRARHPVARPRDPVDARRPRPRRRAGACERRAPVTIGSARMAEAPLLELRGITKRFPGVLANDDVNLDLRHGEVHALLGENGAGKSTLMNILYGLYTPDEGQILLNGTEIDLGSTKAAIEHGIGMVHQHFMLIPVMSVAENIVLATEPRRAGVLLDLDSARRRVRELSQRYGLAVDPDARIESISVGQQQRVEILKALYRGADILILDEPTAVLTPQEAQELFEVVRGLQAQGKSVIFISHKLNEVLEIADRISVLRRGTLVDTVSPEGVTEQDLARLMVGRDVLLRVEKQPAQLGEPLLEVEDLRVLEAVRGVSFQVRAGEILGIAGVDGNGQTELIDAIAGLRKPIAGRVLLDG